MGLFNFNASLKKAGLDGWLDRIFGARTLEKGERFMKPRALRCFEPLEDRIALSASNPTISDLPDSITLYAGSSFHYAIDEGYSVNLNLSSIATGLTAQKLHGPTVTIAYSEVNSSGDVVKSLGEITIQLFEDDAPESVAQFLALVQSGYYDNTSLHRIISDFMMQGGSSSASADKTSIPDEFSDWLLHNSAGIVAYAKGSTTTGYTEAWTSNQFYITQEPTNWLNGKHNVFGFVVSGYDVINNICDNYYTQNASGTQVNRATTVRMTDLTVNLEGSSNILRLTAGANTQPGTYVASLSVTDPYGIVSTKNVTVTVLNDLGTTLVNQMGTSFDVQSGNTKVITLPGVLSDGQQVYSYTVEPYNSYNPSSNHYPNPDVAAPVGVNISYNATTRQITITTADYVSQVFKIKLTLTTASSYSDTVYFDIFVNPNAPELTIDPSSYSGTSSTVTASDQVVYVIDDVYESAYLYFVIKKDDGTEYTATIKSGTTYETSSDFTLTHARIDSLDRVTLTITKEQLRRWLEMSPESDIYGTYTARAWQAFPISDFYDHPDMRADSQTVSITLVENDLKIIIDNNSSVLLHDYYDNSDLVYGEEFRVELTTNIIANDIVFAFKNSLLLPEGADGRMKIVQDSETSKWWLVWTPTQALNAHREYTIALIASDSYGRRDEVQVTFDLATEGPIFTIRLDNATGTIVDGTTLNVKPNDTIRLYLDIFANSTVSWGYSATCVVTSIDDPTVTFEVEVLFTENGPLLSFPMTDLIPGTYTIAITLIADYTDDPELPSEQRTKTIAFLLSTVNTAPEITTAPPQTIYVTVDTPYSLQLTAIDHDLPPQQLTWSFAPGTTIPTGMSITVNGLLSYTPVQGQVASRYEVSVIVTDSGGLVSAPLTLRFSVGAKPVNPDDPDDPDDPDPNPDEESKVKPPAELGSMTNPAELRDAWLQALEYRTAELVAAGTRYLTTFESVAKTASQTIAVAISEYAGGQLSRIQFEEKVAQTEKNRVEEQAKAYETWGKDKVTIAGYFDSLVGQIDSSATTQGIATPATRDGELANPELSDQPWDNYDLVQWSRLVKSSMGLEAKLALITVGPAK